MKKRNDRIKDTKIARTKKEMWPATLSTDSK